MKLDAEAIRAIDEFLLMLARCKTQEERRQLVWKFAVNVVSSTERRIAEKK